jgi:hypothetical protein
MGGIHIVPSKSSDPRVVAAADAPNPLKNDELFPKEVEDSKLGANGARAVRIFHSRD